MTWKRVIQLSLRKNTIPSSAEIAGSKRCRLPGALWLQQHSVSNYFEPIVYCVFQRIGGNLNQLPERAISQNKQVEHAKSTGISTIPICSSSNYHKCLLLGLDWWWVSKKGERLHMVGKRDRLAELLLSQSSEIGLALPPTNQAQSFTQLYHVIDTCHFGHLLIHAPRILGFRILGLRILNPRTEDPLSQD